MNQPKVSIVIPIHNAGQYLNKCLAALSNQTLEDIEIILVLDCPSDGSNKIAEQFEAKDNRFKLLYNTKNLHTGLSRNRGIEIARGKYIGFHDHDDYCESTMYELLYKKAEEGEFDVVRCNFSSIYTENSKEKEDKYIYPDISEKEELFKHVANDSISCVIWNHIYKTDFLKRHNIHFLDSRSICSEDSVFFIDVYNKLNKVGVVPNYLYYHVFHSNNTGKSYNYRSIKNRNTFFEELHQFLKGNGVSDKRCQAYLVQNIASSLYTASRQALLSLPLKEAIAEIRQIKHNKLIMKNINYFYTKENRSALFNLKPTIILFLLVLKRL